MSCFAFHRKQCMSNKSSMHWSLLGHIFYFSNDLKLLSTIFWNFRLSIILISTSFSTSEGITSLANLKMFCVLNTYVQKCRQVLFNEYFIFDRVICRFHITSYVCDKIHVFWWTFVGEDTLWCQSWSSVAPLCLHFWTYLVLKGLCSSLQVFWHMYTAVQIFVVWRRLLTLFYLLFPFGNWSLWKTPITLGISMTLCGYGYFLILHIIN